MSDELKRFASDESARQAARARLDQLTKPRGSLGAIEDLVIRMAGIQQRERPSSRPAAALIAASDHGVTRHGVSAYPAAVTRAMVTNLVRGGAAASVMAKSLAIPLTILDVGVSGPASSSSIVQRDPVADRPLGDLREADAVSESDASRIRDAAASWVCAHDDLSVLVVGELGIGNTTAASAVIAALLDVPPRQAVGPGTGLDHAGWERKTRVVEDALAALGGERDPWIVLRRVGGRDLVALFGAMEEAIARRIVLLVDGFVVAAAALALARLRPEVGERLVFAHCSAEPGHRLVLDALGARPLLELDMRLGEGTGALAAFPLLELACTLHAEMATFAEASVPDRT